MIVLAPRLNEIILNKVKSLVWSVSDSAPSTFGDLVGHGGSLVVWSGESNHSIYGDPHVNRAFRALHDSMHVRFGLSFSAEHEIELARRTAAMFDGTLADLVWSDIAGQVEFFKEFGHFPSNQVDFVLNYLKRLT